MVLSVMLVLGSSARGKALYTALAERTGDSAGSGVGRVTVWPAGSAAAGWAVRDAVSGAVTPHRVVWHRTGEPAVLCFDASSGSLRYWVDALDTAGAATEWRPRAGLTVETRPRPDGPAGTWEESLALWTRAGAATGRSLTDRVFGGVPPHGLRAAFICRFEGWLRVEQAGEYAFATVSDGASFLSVAGRQVTDWPGQQAAEGGDLGQRHGSIRLEAGIHPFEYLNVQGGSGYRVVAAWRKPDARVFEAIPAAAFVPMDAFEVRSIKSQTAVAPVFAWHNEGYAVAGPTTLCDVRLWLPGGSDGREVRWIFDDGLAAEGEDVRHVFVGERLSVVACEVWRDGRPEGRISLPVRLQRNPGQIGESPESRLRPLLRAATRPREIRKRAAAELHPLFAAANATDDPSLAEVAETLVERRRECVGPLAAGLAAAGFYFQRHGRRNPAHVEAAWSAILEDPRAPDWIRASTALHLSGFFIHTGSAVARGMRLLAEDADDDALDESERRLKLIFLGDGRAMLGDRAGAVAAYRKAGRAVADADTSLEARRRAHLDTARHFLSRGEHAAAEQTIRALEWEWPLERLELESGMLMMAIHQARGELDLALAAGRRLLAGAPTDPARPDLLLAVAGIHRGLKQDDAFQATLKQLRREFPNSEAAARAAERYPEK